jgi:hypothetical protein
MPREAPRSQTNVEPDYPWGPFLREVDEKLTEPIQLQCLGGLVVTQYYGVGRETSDIDCIVVLDSKTIDFAGEGSELHKKIWALLGSRTTTLALPCQG